MIEIVFSDSAGGLLKHAQHYGKGPYNDESHPALIYYGVKESGEKETSQEEIDAYLKEYHEKERHAWESAVPLSGCAADVYDLVPSLSVGEIAEDVFSVNRLAHLQEVTVPRSGPVDVDTYLTGNSEDCGGGTGSHLV